MSNLTPEQQEVLYDNVRAAHESGLMRRYTDFLSEWSVKLYSRAEDEALSEERAAGFEAIAHEKRGLVGAELPIAFKAMEFGSKSLVVAIEKVQPSNGEKAGASRVNIGTISVASRRTLGRITSAKYIFTHEDVELGIERVQAQIEVDLTTYVPTEQIAALTSWPERPNAA